jgi:hypothetical protein
MTDPDDDQMAERLPMQRVNAESASSVPVVLAEVACL